MQNLFEVGLAIEYIETHLREPVTVRDIADAAGYSLFHFSRLFNAVVGHSPYDYLMRRRLSEAARELLRTGETVTGVAFAFQFNSLETFSRAYYKMFGQLPNVTKQRRHHGGLILRNRITPEYLEHIGHNRVQLQSISVQDAFHLTGVVISDNALVPYWLSQLQNTLPYLKQRQTPERYYAMEFEPFGGYRFLGIGMAGGDETPGVLLGKALPEHCYARFRHHGGPGTLPLTRDYILQTWLPKSGYRLAAPYLLEAYGSLQALCGNESTGEVAVWVPVTKLPVR